MTRPYLIKIMAQLGNDEPIEITRSKRQMVSHEIKGWTAHLSKWRCWIERPCHPHNLVGWQVRHRSPQ